MIESGRRHRGSQTSGARSNAWRRENVARAPAATCFQKATAGPSGSLDGGQPPPKRWRFPSCARPTPSRRMGCPPADKPHQRFFIKKFFTKKIKSKFYAGYLTAEELIFSNKILRVWAFESSVLVYGAVLFGITSYNIMNKNVIYCSRVKKILEKYTLTLN